MIAVLARGCQLVEAAKVWHEICRQDNNDRARFSSCLDRCHAGLTCTGRRQRSGASWRDGPAIICVHSNCRQRGTRFPSWCSGGKRWHGRFPRAFHGRVKCSAPALFALSGYDHRHDSAAHAFGLSPRLPRTIGGPKRGAKPQPPPYHRSRLNPRAGGHRPFHRPIMIQYGHC